MLLALILLMTAVSVCVSAADDDMPFSTIQLIGTNTWNEDVTSIFYPNHEAKTLIVYSSFTAANVVAEKPRWSALDSNGNVIDGMEVTCDDFKNSSYNDVSAIKVTYQGKTATYLQYHAQLKWPLSGVEYSVTDDRDSDGNLIPEKVSVSPKTTGNKKKDKAKWGNTTVTTTSTAVPSKEVASKSKITLLGFCGAITSIEPKDAVLKQTSNSATVNWYKTTGTVTFTIDGNSLPKDSKLKGTSAKKTITITDKRVVKQTVTPCTNGTIKTVYKEARPGDTVWWTAEPDEGYSQRRIRRRCDMHSRPERY